MVTCPGVDDEARRDRYRSFCACQIAAAGEREKEAKGEFQKFLPWADASMQGFVVRSPIARLETSACWQSWAEKNSQHAAKTDAFTNLLYMYDLCRRGGDVM